jgi:hypothetical protein
MAQEKKYISEFNVNENGTISIRKTTEIIENEEVISSSYWRCVLEVNDPTADEVLGVDTYFRNLAQFAWDSLEK